MPGYTRQSGNTLDVVGVCVNRIGMDQINIGKLNMNIELLDQEIALEAERFGDHIRWYCDVHPQSDLGR